ncbi:MAG TPA: biotin/lipoyl-containing protein, partial [Gaiella sp.]|nr:biotin/lipoyl-containing protein [Gaiella sp.]
MARELTMPKLSDSMADAVIIRWLKGPGEAFTRGDALIEVETDKATVVYEAEWDGTLGAILVPEGGTAGVGDAIATVSNGDGEVAPPRPRVASPEPAPAVASDGGGVPDRVP